MRPRLACSACALLIAVAAGPTGAQEASPAPERAVVAAADLVPAFERDGRLEAADPARVVVRMAEWAGALVVAQVDSSLREGGRVEAGQVLLRLDGADLGRALREAGEAATAAAHALAALEAEGATDEAQARTTLEQAEAAARDARAALARFDALDGPQLLAASALEVEQTEASVADQREELAQLEAIYRGTQLAPDTKEIVLERARRSVKLADEALALARTRRTLLVEHEHPTRRRALDEQARWADAGLARARERAALEQVRRAEALDASKRAARDAVERAARLEADRGRLTVAAPAAGVVEPVDLSPGEAIAQGPLTRVHDPAALVARFTAREEDLRLLAPGRPVKVVVTALPEVALTGRVLRVAGRASQDAAGTGLEVVVAVEGASPLLRPGLRCRVGAAGEPLRRVLVVPRRAVRVDGGRTTCDVWTGDRAQRLEVVLGAGDAESVRVVRGLVSGDEVMLPEEP